MQIHRSEVATGILVLVTFGFLITILFILVMPGVLKPLTTYRIYFDNANGIRPGAPVLLAGREIGKVTALESPVPLESRPKGHPDYEVLIEVRVGKEDQIYYNDTVQLTQQGLMGQQIIDFKHGDESSGLAENGSTFVGERIPGIPDLMSDMTYLTGPASDLALTIKNAKILMETLNHSQIPQVIKNTEQLTDTLKRQPWRLIWPSTKSYGDDKRPSPEKGK